MILYICQKPYSVKHKDWTWVNNKVSVLIHHSKKGTTLMQHGIIHRGKRGRLGMKEVHESFLNFLLNFSIKLKLLQKIKSIDLNWSNLEMSKIEFNRMVVNLEQYMNNVKSFKHLKINIKCNFSFLKLLNLRYYNSPFCIF